MEDNKQPTAEHEMDFNIHLQGEIEKQITEEELFMKILEDERNENT